MKVINSVTKKSENISIKFNINEINYWTLSSPKFVMIETLPSNSEIAIANRK